MTTLWVEQRRGFASEAIHPVDAVSCTASGELRTWSGEDLTTTFRSGSKPFQLEASLGLLHDDARSRLEPDDLALGAASHHGEPFHVAAVERLLGKLGCAADDLHCGAHPPAHAASAQALWGRGELPTTVHNNCAGKHTFMAAAARAQGSAHDYRPADHPLQRAARAAVCAHCGPIAGTVVDGCGVPCFVLTLSAMARGYASLARATRRARSSDSADLAAIGAAMLQRPTLVSGSEAFDAWLTAQTGVIAKVGAGGLMCIAAPAQELGLVLKIRSGAELVRPVATVALLDRLLPGLLQEELPARYRVTTNLAGEPVGENITRFAEG